MAISNSLMIMLMALGIFLTVEPREVPAQPMMAMTFGPGDLCLPGEDAEMSVMAMPDMAMR